MIYEAIRHTGVWPDLYLKDRKTLSVMLRTGRKDAEKCELIIFTRNHPDTVRAITMRLTLRDDLFDYYTCSVEYPDIVCYQKYYFRLSAAKETVYFDRNGINQNVPEDEFYEFLYANNTEVLKVPAWSRGLVYYQIFPERFCNGKKENDPPGTVEWGSMPTRDNYMGGDIEGIINKVDYLSNLGVDIIYFNPVFKADFNHKYAVEDYFQIDPQFGTEEEFRILIARLHDKGIKVVLDGVFNHCGIHFAPFEDLINNQERSEYLPWFFIKQFPVSVDSGCYECIGDYIYMPKLNTAEPAVQEFVLSVMEYWVREYGIDGWRLDVADEADEGLWLYVRMRIKRTYPDLLLMGETWGRGLQLMSGLQMDSIMNYIFRDAVRDFIGFSSIDAFTFNARLQRMLSDYPKMMNDIMFNPLDTHDTPRFLRYAHDEKRRLALAVIFQMMFVGSPAVYYGDEVGISGDNDPDCRKCMVWDRNQQDSFLLWLYKRLIAIRHREDCIRTGSFAACYCKGNCYGFVRYYSELSDEPVYTVINVSSEQMDILLPVLSAGSYVEVLAANEQGVSDSNCCYTAKEFTEVEWEAEHNDAFELNIIDYRAGIRLSVQPWEGLILQKKR